MPNTVPNQKIVHINRQDLDIPFLSINKDVLYAAHKDLEAQGLVLYLYLAGNANGFDLALSQKDAENTMGIKKTSFHKYVNVLIEKGYLVQKSGNVYDFYETPQKQNNKSAVPPCEQLSSRGDNVKPQCDQVSLLDEQDSSQDSIEINKKYPIDRRNKEDNGFVF